MSWTPPAMQRHEALADYLVRLGLDYGAEARPNVPTAFSLDGQTLELDPWERSILQASLCGGSTHGVPWAPLLAEGIAFQAKCLARLGPAGAGKPNGNGTEHESETTTCESDTSDDIETWIVDTAVGLALSEELQRTIHRLVVCGEMTEAKKLTAFRNRVIQTLALLRDRIGDDDYLRAENKSEAMVTPAPPAPLVSRSTGPASGAAPWKPGPEREAERVRVFTRDPPPVNRTRRLALVFAAVTFAWAVFILPRLLQARPHILQPQQFSDIPGIVSVVAKPPAVYITVDADVWDGMSGADRKKQVARIGTVAEEVGYLGADLRDNTGRVIGRWLRTRGAVLDSGS